MKWLAVRPSPNRSLDQAIAEEVAGFRWVEWNHAALRGAPIDRPGRFLARPDDPLAHLHLAAGQDVKPAADALAHVPHYSRLVDAALGAAEAAGVFRGAGATFDRAADGRWRVRIPALDVEIFDTEPAVVLCRAALEWVRGKADR